MAFVLLAIGALMSAAGIYAVVSGYPIIQVEEGWASVISGATLVTGGILTIALALVLRALNEVKAAFRLSPATSPGESTGSFAGPPPPPPLEVPMRPIGTLPETAGHGDILHPAPNVVAEKPEESPAAAVDHAPVEAEPVKTVAHDLIPEELPDEAATIPHPEAELQLETPRPADDYKLESPSTSEHDIIPSVRHEPFPLRETPVSPPMDDWLDRAFAELDRDTPPISPKPQTVKPQTAKSQTNKPDARKPILAPAIAEPSLQREPLSPEPAALPSAPADHGGEPQDPARDPSSQGPSAVIGRYESEGTMYVMYADGSIEAQSASGVYRFASMAELKSFIEN